MAFALIALCVAGDPPPPEFEAGNEELRGYIVEALENHPALRARHDEWLAALERVPQARALEDPMFTYGQFIQSESLRFRAMLAQKFPWMGVRKVRADKASAEAEAAFARLCAERNRIIADVKRAYFEYAFLGEQLAVSESQIEILAFMEEIVDSRLALALAGEADLLRVSIEKTAMRDRRDGFMAMRPAVAAKLNEAMGGLRQDEPPWPQTSTLPGPLPTIVSLLERANAANPDLEYFDHMIESRENQLLLARKKGYPDITLGLEYVSTRKPDIKRPDRPYPASLNAANRIGNMISGAMPFNAATTAIDAYSLATYNEPMSYPDDPKDNIALSLTVNLPIWRKKINAGIEEARLLKSATVNDKRRRQIGLESAVRQTAYEIEDARRRHVLYREVLLPQAKLAFDSLQGDYAAGGIDADFLDVMRSIQMLLDFELEQLRAARDWQVATAKLEFLTGGPWETQTEAHAVSPEPKEEENGEPWETDALDRDVE